MNYYLAVIKKYAVFSGRANRAEYWYFFLINLVIASVFSAISNSTGSIFMSIIGAIYSLGFLIPGIAVTVRRLHDIGKSGVMIFIALIPIIGWIWILVLLATKGDAGDNSYGSVHQGATEGKTPIPPTTPPPSGQMQ